MARPYITKSKILNVGDIAADSDAIKIPVWRLPYKIKITAVYFGVDTAITAQDTDYNLCRLTDVTNDIASIVTGPAATGDSLVAGTPLAASVGVVAAYAEQDAGAVLQLEFTKTGAGLAMSGFWVQIDYEDYGS